MVALLLGLVVSIPMRTSALENTMERGNMAEGEITQPREIGPLTNAMLGALVGPLAGALAFVLGLAGLMGGFAIMLTFFGIPIGLICIFLSLILIFIVPILCVVIGSPLGFIFGFVEEVESIPESIGDFVVRLVDACRGEKNG
jgi:hypothetical protein